MEEAYPRCKPDDIRRLSLLQKCADFHPLIAGERGDGAVTVGTIQAASFGFDPFQHFWTGMAERIRLPDGNGHEAGTDCPEKLSGGRGSAAVVGNLEEIRPERLAVTCQYALHLAFDIAGKQENFASVLEAQDQGIAIARRFLGVAAGGPEDAHLRARPLERVAPLAVHNRHTARSGFANQRAIGRRLCVAADPKFADPKVAQNRS